LSIIRREDLYRRARDLYGEDAQLDMLGEECAEVLVELFHKKRAREHNLADEVADLTIMAEQARLIIGPAEVDAAVARKLERLRDRVEKGETKRRTLRVLDQLASVPPVREVAQ
jgi:hypothetical protein